MKDPNLILTQSLFINAKYNESPSPKSNDRVQALLKIFKQTEKNSMAQAIFTP
jgi:hypothetical protein